MYSGDELYGDEITSGDFNTNINTPLNNIERERIIVIMMLEGFEREELEAMSSSELWSLYVDW